VQYQGLVAILAVIDIHDGPAFYRFAVRFVDGEELDLITHRYAIELTVAINVLYRMALDGGHAAAAGGNIRRLAAIGNGHWHGDRVTAITVGRGIRQGVGLYLAGVVALVAGIVVVAGIPGYAHCQAGARAGEDRVVHNVVVFTRKRIGDAEGDHGILAGHGVFHILDLGRVGFARFVHRHHVGALRPAGGVAFSAQFRSSSCPPWCMLKSTSS
jgi:hypothetical protein